MADLVLSLLLGFISAYPWRHVMVHTNHGEHNAELARRGFLNLVIVKCNLGAM